MIAEHQSQGENEFRNIKLKLKGPIRHSELQAVKALMAMSAQQNVPIPKERSNSVNSDDGSSISGSHGATSASASINNDPLDYSDKKRKGAKQASISRAESPEPVYGLSISMTEEEFKELAEREGIEDVIGEPICKLCGGLFSGPLGIALHMCPAMKRQTFRCEICGEDKWKTKANLHSHIKWCKKRLSLKTGQLESKQIY